MFDAEEWLIDNLDGAKLSGVKEINATCPFGDCGKGQKLYANRNTGAFICFACDRRGKSAIALVAEVEGLSHREAAAKVLRGITANRRKGSVEAFREQAEDGFVDVATFDGKRAQSVEAKSLVEAGIPAETIPIFKAGRKPKEWRVPTYLRERGITRESAAFWGLGFCKSGRYEGRLILPIECPNGRSFTARDMTGELQPKYMNPTGVNHRRLLFGWKTITGGGDVVICEGPLDAVALRQAGFNAVAILGKALLDAKFALLCRLAKSTPITIMLDPEARVEALEAATALKAHFDRVFVAQLPDGTDPGDASVEAIRAAVDGAERFTGAHGKPLRAAISKARGRLGKFEGYK